jgi:hypothetical protein
MKIEMHVFDQVPIHDTCWSIITGADNHAYVAACCEYRAGVGVVLVRYNTVKKKVEYMLEVADAVGQPSSNGRASQCKIHYSLVSGNDGILYGATHTSAPGKGQRFFSPWNNWRDEKRGFPGGMLFAFDPKKEKVLFYDNLCPNEGCRCLALDQKRMVLYGITYPRNHFFWYDIETHKRVDVGRIGNVNPQAIFLDHKNRAYTTDDYGHLMRFDLDKGDFDLLDIQVPHAPYQDGQHTILYDVVQVPGENAVVGTPWCPDPHFFKYTFDRKNGPGHIQDLGPTVYQRSGYKTSCIQSDHTGGLVFGKDGLLYYCANVPVKKFKKPNGHWVSSITLLMRMDISTGHKEQLRQLKFGTFNTWYVSRAVRDREGNLYLADVANLPCRMYKVIPDYSPAVRRKKEPESIIMRNWG